jgi:hypothetical protein
VNTKYLLAGGFAVLALLTGATGCKDQPPAAAPATNQPASASTPAGKETPAASQSETPGDSEETPASAEETTPAEGKGGGDDPFCQKFQDEKGAMSAFASSGDGYTAEEVTEAKAKLQSLADEAPGEVKQPMQVIARDGAKLLDRTFERSDQKGMQELAAAIEAFNNWYQAHCGGDPIQLEGPGAK